MPQTLLDPGLAFGELAVPTASLDRLPVGDQARIVTVLGDPRTRRRLLEMGLCPGVLITNVRRAPMRDPIAYQVRGYHLSLRAEQAEHVIVTTDLSVEISAGTHPANTTEATAGSRKV